MCIALDLVEWVVQATIFHLTRPLKSVDVLGAQRLLTNPDINSAAKLGPKVALIHRAKDEQQR